MILSLLLVSLLNVNNMHASLQQVVADNDMTFIDDKELNSLKEAVKLELDHFNKNPNLKLNNNLNDFSKTKITNTLKSLLTFLSQEQDPKELNKFILSKFKLYKETGKKVNFTAYYIPTLNGSYVKNSIYKYPVYGIPSGSQKELTRKQIENGALTNAPILLYIDDYIDLYNLHMQGSGEVKLTNGKYVKLSYAGNNRKPFNKNVHISKEKFKQNPAMVKQESYKNERYIFFSINNSDSHKGSLGVPLVNGRAISADPDFFPKGALAFVRTDNPNVTGRFVLDIDTGKAIKGSKHIDFYFGDDADVEKIVHNFNTYGEIYYLVAK